MTQLASRRTTLLSALGIGAAALVAPVTGHARDQNFNSDGSAVTNQVKTAAAATTLPAPAASSTVSVSSSVMTADTAEGHNAAGLNYLNAAFAAKKANNSANATSNFTLAVGEFSKAIAFNKPGFDEPYNNRGAGLVELGQYDAAIKDLNVALKMNPNNPRAHANLGNAYYRTGKFTYAISEYGSALRNIDPSDTKRLAGIAESMARAYTARGMATYLAALPTNNKLGFENALSDYDNANAQRTSYSIPLDFEAVKTRTQQGFALIKVGRYELAVQSFDAANAIHATTVAYAGKVIAEQKANLGYQADLDTVRANTGDGAYKRALQSFGFGPEATQLSMR